MTDTQVYASGVDENQTPSDLRTVSAAGLAAVQAKVEKANRKAARLGLDARLHLVVVERRTVKTPAYDGQPVDLQPEREVVDHRIVGDEVVLPGGWKFLAALDHSNPEANVVRRAPNLADDVEVPTWARTAAPACDHCNQDRRRNDTYLVVNDEGTVQQVGSSCLVDFLGLTPAQVGWVFEGVESGGSDEGSGERHEVVLPTATYLTVVAHLIRTEGWVSRRVAAEYEKVATADAARNVLLPVSEWEKRESKRIYNALTNADEKVATDAAAWLVSDDFDVQGDYGWNLRAAFGTGSHVTLRNAGIAASLVFCWLRKSEQLAERKAKAAASTSVHEGKVGEKVTLDLTVTGVRTFDGDYGARLLVKAVTPTGSEVTSWTSPSTAFGRWATSVAGDGATYKVLGTVKAHETYEGTAQTNLTRAKVVA